MVQIIFVFYPGEFIVENFFTVTDTDLILEGITYDNFDFYTRIGGDSADPDDIVASAESLIFIPLEGGNADFGL